MKVVPVTCRYAGSPELVEKVTQAIKVHQNNQKAIAFGIASARLLEAILLGAPLQEALATVEKNLPDELKSSEYKEDVIQAFAKGKKAGEEGGRTLDDILLEISHDLMKDKPDSPFYDLAGRSCALPGSFIGPIALFYKASMEGKEPKETFIAAVRDNILGAGDTCSRAVFVGATLAAAGVSSTNDVLPTDWIKKMDNDTMKKIDSAIQAFTVESKS